MIAFVHEQTAGSNPSARVVFPLMIGAIGVVFGDIGTSPLYTLKAVLTVTGGQSYNETELLGVISMIAWCLVLVVTFTYVGVILRADNQGEGGILSLASLIRRRVRHRPRLTFAVIVISVIGASLFLGDSLITPAISVLSAAEGLTVINSSLQQWVVPVSLVVLTLLFAFQHKGTGHIGRAFGPVMTLWFVTLAALGLPWIARHPEVLLALSPTYAIGFVIHHPWGAFLALGASVLAVTGAEALYADLGHFGRKPIFLAWMLLAFPALLLNYLGQGALLLEKPEALASPLFSLAPQWALIPLVILATVATVIASQAVIAGAFSIVRQAIRASFLPRLKVVQTSPVQGGQIYLPVVNMILFLGVVILVAQFGSSERLASAYGLAVTGTLLLELTLFLVFAHFVWHWKWWKIAIMVVFSGVLELTLFLANVPKIISGGWLPLSISAVIATIMFTWYRGSRIMFGRRRALEGPLQQFIDSLRARDIKRVPGIAVYPHGDLTTTPLALRASANFTHVLPEHVVILTIKNVGVPTVPEDRRVVIDNLGWEDDGIVHVLYRVGFKDPQDVPAALRLAVNKSCELEFDPEQATYVLSVFRIEPAEEDDKATWPRWQRQLFRRLEKTSANRTNVFHLPPERTIIVGSEVHV